MSDMVDRPPEEPAVMTHELRMSLIHSFVVHGPPLIISPDRVPSTSLHQDCVDLVAIANKIRGSARLAVVNTQCDDIRSRRNH